MAEAVAEKERRTAGGSRGDVARSEGHYLCCWDGGRPVRKSYDCWSQPRGYDWRYHRQMATHSVDRLRET